MKTKFDLFKRKPAFTSASVAVFPAVNFFHPSDHATGSRLSVLSLSFMIFSGVGTFLFNIKGLCEACQGRTGAYSLPSKFQAVYTTLI